MKGFLKRILSVLTAIAMVYTVFATPLGEILGFIGEGTSAKAAYYYGDYAYSVLSDGTVEITDYNGGATELEIPSVIDGKTVTSIGDDAFWSCSSLTSITIPDGVTSIGDSAFSLCSSLTTVTIGNGVVSIDDNAFWYCSSLTSINIPDSVTSIGQGAFYYCSALTTVIIPDSVTIIGRSAFYGCSSLSSINIPNSVTSIDICVFYDCSSLESINIPDSVTSIGDYAFYRCYELTSVTIPDSVTSIGDYAFYGCSSLTSINIPDSVTSIGWSAFANCTSLTSVSIGDSVTSIGRSAFSYCYSLTSINIPDGVTSIGEWAFEYCSSLTSIVIPDSVTRVDQGIFRNCSSLTSVIIPDSVTIIGRSAFYGCSSLSSINIPNSVTSIVAYAFYSCSSLTSITIPGSVTIIDGCAFEKCSSLTSVTIGKGTTRIGSQVFNGCSSLTSITIPDGVTSIDDSAFSMCYKLVIYGLPGSYAETYALRNNIPFTPTNYIVPDVVSKATYIIKTVTETGVLLTSGTATDGVTTFPMINGVITVKNPQGSTITLSADGCANKTLTLYELSTQTINPVKMRKDSSVATAIRELDTVFFSTKSDIDTAYKNGTIRSYIDKGYARNILNYTHRIDLVKKELNNTKYYDFYLYAICEEDNAAKYTVYCGKTIVAESTSPKITVNTKKMTSGEKITIKVTFDNGTSKTYKLNLEVTDNGKKDFEYSIKQDSVSISYPKELSWLGTSSSFSMPKTPLYVTVTDDEIRIGAGIKKDILDDDDSFSDFGKAFEEFSKNMKTSSDYLKAKSLTELKKKYLATPGKSQLPSLKDSLEISVLGYGSIKLNNGKIPDKAGFTLIITAQYEVGFSWQFFVVAVPVVVDIRTGIELEAEFSSSISGIASGNISFNSDLNLTITPYIEPFAGVGIKNVASVGVYGRMSMPIEICLLSTDKNKMGLNSVDINGSAGIKAQFLFFTHKLDIFNGSINLYTRPTLISQTIATRAEMMNPSFILQESTLESVLNAENYSATETDTSVDMTENANGLIAQNMSGFSQADVLTEGDITIFTAVNTDTDRGINNQSYVVTSVLCDGVWSEPVAVNNTNYAEFAPKLYKSGEDIFLIYQQATKEFDDNADMETITASMGIAVSKFNRETMTFENTGVVYSTDGYSFAIDTTDNCAVWYHNADGTPFGNSENNSIVLYDGTSATVLKEGISNVLALEVGKFYGETYIAYTLDSDGNYETTDDIQLYIINTSGGEPVLVSEGSIGNIQFTEANGGQLIWKQDSVLKTVNGIYSTATILTEADIGESFGVLSDSSIYYIGSNQNETVLYVMNKNNDGFSNAYEYSRIDGIVGKITVKGDSILYNVFANEESTDICNVLYEKITDSTDLKLNGVDFETEYLVSTSQIPLTVSLTNNGSDTVDNVAFRILDENKNHISFYTLGNLFINPGETTECTILVNAEDNLIGKKFYVVAVEPSALSNITSETLDTDIASDKTPENNECNMDFTKSDIAVKINELKFGEIHSLIVTVFNNTDIAGNGTISITDKEGNEIHTQDFENLTFEDIITIELDRSDLIPEGFFSQFITVTVTSNEEEYYTYNNSTSQYIENDFPINVDEISYTDINENSLTLSFTNPGEGYGIEIEQLVDDEWQNIATINDAAVNSYLVSNLSASTEYGFRMRVFADFGNELGYSEYVYLTVHTCHLYTSTVVEPTYENEGYTLHECSICGGSYKDNIVEKLSLASVTGFKLNVRNSNSLTFKWNKNTSATGYVVQQYKDGAWTDIAKITSNVTTSYNVTGLSPSVTYQFRIRGYKTSGSSTVYSNYSGTVTATTTPTNVTGLKLSSRNSTSLTLSWNKNTSATGYVVQQYKDGAWTDIAKITSNATTSYNVTGLSPSVTYQFRVRAYKVNDYGTLYGGYSGTVTATTTPTNVTGHKLSSRNSTSLTLSWNKNTSATGYVVQQYKDGAWVDIATITSNATTSYNVTGLSPSVTYQFRVRAYKVNDYGTLYGGYSGTVTATTTPTNVTGLKLSSRNSTSLTLSWNKNTSATGYVVQQYKDGAWVDIATITSNATTSYSVTGLSPSVTYQFRVRAYKVNDYGTLYGGYSGTVTATTTPTNVTGHKLSSRNSTSLTLSWNKNTSATGYVVQQYKDGAWTDIAKITSNATTSYNVTGLSPSVTYQFRVRAYKVNDYGTLYGGYSGTVTATTTPTNVTGLKLSSGNSNSLTLSWDKNTSATGYVVQQYKDGVWVDIATITSNATTSYSVTGLTASTTYQFRVRAYKVNDYGTLYGGYTNIDGTTTK